jgi:hypothetical protein
MSAGQSVLSPRARPKRAWRWLVLKSLVSVEPYADAVAELDLHQELARNKDLAASGDARIDQHRRELRIAVRERLKLLRRNLSKSVVLLLSAIGVAVVFLVTYLTLGEIAMVTSAES